MSTLPPGCSLGTPHAYHGMVEETILSRLTVVMGTFASCMITRLATSLEGAHDQRPLSPGAPVGCNGDAQPHGRGVRLR